MIKDMQTIHREENRGRDWRRARGRVLFNHSFPAPAESRVANMSGQILWLNDAGKGQEVILMVDLSMGDSLIWGDMPYTLEALATLLDDVEREGKLTRTGCNYERGIWTEWDGMTARVEYTGHWDAIGKKYKGLKGWEAESLVSALMWEFRGNPD